MVKLSGEIFSGKFCFLLFSGFVGGPVTTLRHSERFTRNDICFFWKQRGSSGRKFVFQQRAVLAQDQKSQRRTSFNLRWIFCSGSGYASPGAAASEPTPLGHLLLWLHIWWWLTHLWGLQVEYFLPKLIWSPKFLHLAWIAKKRQFGRPGSLIFSLPCEGLRMGTILMFQAILDELEYLSTHTYYTHSIFKEARNFHSPGVFPSATWEHFQATGDKDKARRWERGNLVHAPNLFSELWVYKATKQVPRSVQLKACLEVQMG